MPKKRVKPEQVVMLLRQIEVAVANGKATSQACKDAEVTEQTYYRWRKEYGGLKLDQARRLKELEKENARLKRVVADLALEKQVLRDVAQGNFYRATAGCGGARSGAVRTVGTARLPAAGPVAR
jgi:transposase-like protein